jgi:hypothetical protein
MLKRIASCLMEAWKFQQLGECLITLSMLTNLMKNCQALPFVVVIVYEEFKIIYSQEDFDRFFI